MLIYCFSTVSWADSYIYQLTAHLSMVPVMLLAIFVFFVLTYFLAEGVVKLTGVEVSRTLFIGVYNGCAKCTFDASAFNNGTA